MDKTNKTLIVAIFLIILLFTLVTTNEVSQPVKTSYAYDRHFSAIDYSPDDRYIVVGDSIGGSIRAWDIVEGVTIYEPAGVFNQSRMMKLIDKKQSDEISDLEFSQDGKYLVACSINDPWAKTFDDESQVTLYSVGDWEIIRTHYFDSEEIYDAAFSPDNLTYAIPYEKSLAEDQNQFGIEIWNISPGRSSQQFFYKNQMPSSIAYTPDGKFLVAGFDKDVVFFDVESGAATKVIETSAYVSDIQFSPNGSFFVTRGFSYPNTFYIKGVRMPSYNWGVTLWNATSGEEIYFFNGFQDSTKYLSLSPSGKYMAATDESKIRVWDVDSKELLMDSYLSHYASTITDIAFSNNNNQIAITIEAKDDYDGITDYETWKKAVDGGANYTQLGETMDFGDSAVFIYELEDIRAHGPIDKIFGLFTSSQLESTAHFANNYM